MSVMEGLTQQHSRVPTQIRHATPASPQTRLPRVILLIGQLGLGGAEKQLVLLASGLRERDVATTVITLFRTGPRERDLQDAGVRVINLGIGRLRPTPVGAWHAIAAVVQLAKVLRRERPDVLHAFLFIAYVLAPAAAALARVPVLVAGRRSLGDYKDGHRLARLIEHLATRRTRLLIANAHAVAADTLARERVASDKVLVIPNGLPRAAFEPAAAAVVNDPAGPVVVCVANLKVYKGHRHLLSAAALLQERGRALTLLLIGEGPERENLTRQATEQNLDVRLLGHRTDVANFLARADLAVLPSLTEGMSNAIMEAMALGLPMVATDVGGSSELLDGRGLLVPPGDVQALAAAIERILADPEQAAQCGAAARRFAQDALSADTMVERYLSVYRALMEH